MSSLCYYPQQEHRNGAVQDRAKNVHRAHTIVFSHLSICEIEPQ